MLRDLLASILLFSGILIGLSVFISSLAKSYQVNIDDLSQLSSVKRIEEETKALEEALRSSQITQTPLDLPLIIVKGAYSIFKLILKSFIEIWDGFINSISSYLFLPTWFTSILISLVAIFVIFEIISIIMKYKV